MADEMKSDATPKNATMDALLAMEQGMLAGGRPTTYGAIESRTSALSLTGKSPKHAHRDISVRVKAHDESADSEHQSEDMMNSRSSVCSDVQSEVSVDSDYFMKKERQHFLKRGNSGLSGLGMASMKTDMFTAGKKAGYENKKETAVSESAAGLWLPLQILIYAAALGLLVLVILAPTFHHGHGGHGHSGDEHDHGGHGGQRVMRTVAFSFVAAGTLAYLMHLLKQPILLGYLLGGVLIGPIGLRIIISEAEIHTLSELGLIFLLFMIGLELNVSELMALGKQVFVAGAVQFPICMAFHYGLFQLFGLVGFSLGGGQFAILYMSACCALSSTMIVVKLLQAKAETETQAGKITIGILIFQDLWAIVFLAIQPNMANPNVIVLLRTFSMMAVLVALSFAYSKYVLPPVLKSASAATELLLVLALTWCFFICCVALLEWVSLSMELAALIAGMSMASFPYSVELNSKIKYIRDFFITLYFVALGMQIPVPKVYLVGMAVLVSIVVILGRWVGVFATLYMLDAGSRPASLATINLSQVSEFALVICALGKSLNHIGEDGMTIMIWTFAILAVSASYLIGYNDKIYSFLAEMAGAKTEEEPLDCGRDHKRTSLESVEEESDAESCSSFDPRERNIVFLGCFTVGWALIDEIERRRPELLKRIVVIDYNSDKKEKFEEKGIAFSYGDIGSPDVLSYHEGAKLVISTVPDSVLRGIDNKRIVEQSKEVWPNAQVIAIANSVDDASEMYKVGADYVLMITKLGAKRISEIFEQAPDSLDLTDVLEHMKGSDNPHIRRITARQHQKS